VPKKRCLVLGGPPKKEVQERGARYFVLSAYPDGPGGCWRRDEHESQERGARYFVLSAYPDGPGGCWRRDEHESSGERRSRRPERLLGSQNSVRASG
jgi:hypothetical protein